VLFLTIVWNISFLSLYGTGFITAHQWRVIVMDDISSPNISKEPTP